MTQAGAKGGAKRGLGDMWGLSMMGKPKGDGGDGESGTQWPLRVEENLGLGISRSCQGQPQPEL